MSYSGIAILLTALAGWMNRQQVQVPDRKVHDREPAVGLFVHPESFVQLGSSSEPRHGAAHAARVPAWNPLIPLGETQ